MSSKKRVSIDLNDFTIVSVVKNVGVSKKATIWSSEFCKFRKVIEKHTDNMIIFITFYSLYLINFQFKWMKNVLCQMCPHVLSVYNIPTKSMWWSCAVDVSILIFLYCFIVASKLWCCTLTCISVIENVSSLSSKKKRDCVRAPFQVSFFSMCACFVCMKMNQICFASLLLFCWSVLFVVCAREFVSVSMRACVPFLV